MIYPEKGKLYATRGHPKPCLPCQHNLEETIGFHAQAVMHADLIPTFVGLRIFSAMPQRVRMQAIMAALRGKGAPVNCDCVKLRALFIRTKCMMSRPHGTVLACQHAHLVAPAALHMYWFLSQGPAH